jgi:hypothetical protein
VKRQRVIAAACIVFLAWFSMKFHMDTANDSETQAYVSSLLQAAASHGVTQDATDHYAALAPYFMWPIASVLELVTGAYLIRGLVVALLVLNLALYASAYAWFRTLKLSSLTSLIGLVLLSTSQAFAGEYRGWELDKLMEPVLFLVAAIAAFYQRRILFLVVAVLAVVNRETGVFVPLAALTLPTFNARRWAFWTALVVCIAFVAALRLVSTQSTAPLWGGVSAYETINVLGGFSVLPILALAWSRSAPSGLRVLLYLLTPLWYVFVVATDHLVQGAVVLAPLALLWIPISLLGVEQSLGARGAAPVPAVPAER